MEKVYRGGSTIAGRIRPNKTVTYKKIMTKAERRTLLLFSLVILGTCAGFIFFITGSLLATPLSIVLMVAMLLVLCVELIRLLLSVTILIFAWFAKDPQPMVPARGLRVAVLTTIVPGKEPFELVATTLKEMKRIEVGKGNTLDVWLLDEGNDAKIKTACKAMGVRHFSRKGVEKWNTASGPFRARTKAGNHNAWRDKHEKSYDIVAQMDPDHVPRRNFLMRTLGYFTDPDVAFVVAPQVYGNLKNNWIARASAAQSYIFHGIIQRGGNGLTAPLLIGTNHLYRVEAFRQIQGYQDSIIEDHLTSMAVAGATNEKTGLAWKGVYTPDLLAVGEGPSSYTDYFNQQKRWAYGIWEIVSSHSGKAMKNMTKRQALTFAMLQFFYPSLAISWILGAAVTLLFSGLFAQFEGLGPVFAALWVYAFASTLGLFLWLRRFNLAGHERKSWAMDGMLLTMMCIPVYVSAWWEAVIRKPLTYAVTAKGNLASPDSLQTFTPHLRWLIYNTVLLDIFLLAGTGISTSSVIWTLVSIVTCGLPIVVFSASRFATLRLRIAKALPDRLFNN